MARHPNALEFLEILNSTSSGSDLNIYQSIRLLNTEFHEDLFNDWGLHHLHLESRNTVKNGFVKRADYLLFAKFTLSDAYFIDVQGHREKPLWGKRELIGIIQENWNHLLKPYEMRGPVYPDFSDEDIEIMRKKGYLFGVNVNGKGYMRLGAGQSTAGNNLDANRLADNVCRWIWANKPLYGQNQSLFKSQLLYELYIHD